ncbi:MAG: TIGR00266 family protein [Spirochaetota bacterium]
MNVELLARPASTAAKVVLAGGETVTAEGGSMIAMSDDMQVDTRVRRNEGSGGGGLLRGMARRLAGEGIFLNHYTAGASGGELYLATGLPGDMEVIELDGSTPVSVQNSSFVAHEGGVEMNVSWGGMKNVFSGESLIWLRMSGAGKVVLNAFGAIYPVRVDGEYVVDTGNIAAFEETLEFKVTKAGKSLVGSIAGGEGLVCRFSGTGTVWCQTHADRTFGAKLTPHLVPKKN